MVVATGVTAAVPVATIDPAVWPQLNEKPRLRVGFQAHVAFESDL